MIFCVTISPPLRFGSALCSVAEQALGRQESEHRRDGSATIQAQIHHRQALLAPHRSVGFLGACAASCSCLQEEPPSSSPLAHKKSISHTPYGATLIEEVISAVAVAEIVKLPRLRGTDSVSHLFLIDEHCDRPQIPSEVTCVLIRLQGNELAHSTHRPSIDSEGRAKANRFHVTYAFNRLGESIADALHKGNHVLVDGLLVSSKYERENGKSKKAKAAKVAVFWSVRANSVRRLSRAEAEAPVAASSPEAGSESGEASF